MRNIVLTLALISSIVLGGCATKGPGSSNSTETAKPAESAARTTKPVAVPTASAKKVVMSMTGPKTVVEAKDWAEFKREWRETFADYAKAAGIEFGFVDGEVKPQALDGTILQVNVADYRIVGIGARIWFGMMTGSAFIDAKVKFINLRDGATFGEQQHNTASSLWTGAFAKTMTPQQVDAIGAEVFRDLKPAK